jgi:acyl transferase domain-containing protein
MHLARLLQLRALARVGFVAVNSDEAQQFLQIAVDAIKDKLSDEAWEHPKGIYYRKNGLDVQGSVVALFSGQGAQYVEYGARSLRSTSRRYARYLHRSTGCS